jgi:hypothetical protein
MLTLQQIGKRCGTDKAATSHAFNGKTYLHVLAQYFEPMRQRPLRILEIGVKSGQSLRTWAQYFPKAQVIGLDIDPQCRRFHAPDRRVHVITGSQVDPAVLNKVLACAAPKGLDIVVDDGSHVVKHIITSFEHLFPKMNAKGLYAIEDLACSYKKLQTDYSVRTRWPGMRFNPVGENFDNDRGEFNDWILEKIKMLDCRHKGTVQGVNFHHQMVVVRKA